MGASRPISPAISVQVQGQLPNIKLLSAAEEEELIKKCEENIKQGQFNVTNKNIKPTIQSYRARNIKFHKDQMIVSKAPSFIFYLVIKKFIRPFSDLGDCVSSGPVGLKSSK